MVAVLMAESIAEKASNPVRNHLKWMLSSITSAGTGDWPSIGADVAEAGLSTARLYVAVRARASLFGGLVCTSGIVYCSYMPAGTSSPITEADILNEVIAPNRPGLNHDAAKAILALRLSENAQLRIRALLDAGNRGVMSASERADLDKYLRVGQLLDLLQAKARVSLAESES